MFLIKDSGLPLLGSIDNFCEEMYNNYNKDSIIACESVEIYEQISNVWVPLHVIKCIPTRAYCY